MVALLSIYHQSGCEIAKDTSVDLLTPNILTCPMVLRWLHLHLIVKFNYNVSKIIHFLGEVASDAKRPADKENMFCFAFSETLTMSPGRSVRSPFGNQDLYTHRDSGIWEPQIGSLRVVTPFILLLLFSISMYSTSVSSQTWWRMHLPQTISMSGQ